MYSEVDLTDIEAQEGQDSWKVATEKLQRAVMIYHRVITILINSCIRMNGVSKLLRLVKKSKNRRASKHDLSANCMVVPACDDDGSMPVVPVVLVLMPLSNILN